MERFIAQDRADTLTLPTVMARGGAILLAAVAVSTLAGAFGAPRLAPEAPPALVASDTVSPEVAALRAELAEARSALSVERLKNRRADAVQGFSTTYAIPADLASAIYDHAVTEGID